MPDSKDIYTTGGTINSPEKAYVIRKADNELLKICLEGDFAYVLTSRQMGKSSLKVRTGARLIKEHHINVAMFDMSIIGVEQVTFEQWYFGLLSTIGQALGLEKAEIRAYWQDNLDISPQHRMSQFLEEVLLPFIKGQIIIFIDEIDTIRSLSFSTDDFFAAIRALYNNRAENPELKRLSFVLIGSIMPNDLISDPVRTPFNIGIAVELNDFSPEEAKPLKEGFPPELADELLERVLYWTDGHPYLTQRLCAEVARETTAGYSGVGKEFVDSLVKKLFFDETATTDSNLDFVKNMLTQRLPEGIEVEVLLGVYLDILKGKLIKDDPQSLVHNHLKLSGVVKLKSVYKGNSEVLKTSEVWAIQNSSDSLYLKVRNRIYEKVFGKAWIKENMPSKDRTWLRHFAEMAERYKQGFGGLLSDGRLDMALELLPKYKTGLEKSVVEFIEESQHEQQKQEAKEKQYIEDIEKARIKAEENAELALVRQLGAQAVLAAVSPSPFNGSASQACLYAKSAYKIRKNLENLSNILRTLQNTPPELQATLFEHLESVTCVAFSPNGNTLASGSDDQSIILWDVKKRQPLGEPLTGHKDGVRNVTFSPDGNILASGSLDQSIILWDVKKRQPLGEPLTKHKNWVWSLAFSPDGNTLASGSEDQSIILWDVKKGQSLGKPLTGHKNQVLSVAFSPDGNTLASGSSDQNIVLWDVKKRQPLGKPLTGHKDGVWSVDFSPDGNTLASGSSDQNIILWDIKKGQPLSKPFTGHKDRVRSVAFSPDGNILASGSEDQSIILWDVKKRRQLGETLSGHKNWVSDIAFSPDGSTLASVSYDQSIILWNTKKRQLLGELLTGHHSRVCNLAFSPDGNTLASSSEDQSIILWNIKKCQPLGEPFIRHKSAVWSVAFSPDGNTLASGSNDNSIILWDVKKRQPLGELPTGYKSWVWSVAFSPDGNTLASGSLDQSITLWDVKKRQPLGEPLTGHKHLVWSVAFSPDGNILASGSFDQSIILWDIKKRQPLGKPITGHKGAVRNVTFSPDGNILASGSFDQSIILWDVKTHQPLGEPLTGHKSAVWSVAFSPDGNTLASGSSDQSIILWDVKTHQPLGEPLTGHKNQVLSVAFSPDGNTLASGGEDQNIILWDVNKESWLKRACQIAGRNFTKAEWQKYLGDRPYEKTCPQYPEGS